MIVIINNNNLYVYSAPNDDKITSLPGLDKDIFSKLGFVMYSGYVNINIEDNNNNNINDNNGRKIFYWFVSKEGSKDYTKEPTLLWTNGGPGCSGMVGFLTEQGPFRPTKDGKTLERTEFAWNQLANIVFIEQPVGVGFSQTDQAEEYNDENAANDNRKFVVGFFEKFPELKNSPFYIASESYGGHYMPTLAKNILDHPGSVPNFKGLLVGNPLIWTPNNDLGEFETLAGHQILPGPLVASFMKNGCMNVNIFRLRAACRMIYNRSQDYKQGLDPYAMDFPLCNDASAMKRIQIEERKKEMEKLLSSNDKELDDLNKLIPEVPKMERRLRNDKSQRNLQYFPNKYEPCAESYAEDYLNRADVQKAIHALPPQSGSFHSCNDEININYSRESFNANMVPIYESLMGKIKITIFSGDDDTVCATAGLQHWIWNYNVVSQWQQWKITNKEGDDEQIAGYHVSFTKTPGNTKADMNVYTVHGAGHMVPSTRPHAGYAILKRFLADSD